MHFPEREELPESLALYFYPNPANPGVTIHYQLPYTTRVTLNIYNILGEKIAALVNRFEAAGSHCIMWDGKDESGREVSSGLYFIRCDTGDRHYVSKLSLIR